jgi:predicted ATPase
MSQRKLVHDPTAAAAMQGRGAVLARTSRRVFTVALTGGPCSGKSSSLEAFTRELTARGLDVYSVPEVPTIVLNAGFPYPGLAGGALLQAFENAIARTQVCLENEVLSLAAARDALERSRPAVVFFDRGLLDLKAYCAPATWAAALAAVGVDEDTARARYDLVIHLQTAAIGAEAFYTTANNAARTEGLAEARELDARVQDAWAGHAAWRCVPNREGASFADKVAEATRHVLALVGLEGEGSGGAGAV